MVEILKILKDSHYLVKMAIFEKLWQFFRYVLEFGDSLWQLVGENNTKFDLFRPIGGPKQQTKVFVAKFFKIYIYEILIRV